MSLVFRVVGNFFWKMFGGFALSIVWFVLGLALSLTIIFYPIGIRCFKIGYLVWKPFGKDVVIAVERYPISNIVWAMSAGLVLSVFALISGLVFTVSLVGLPLLKQWYKVMKVSIFPFGAYIK